MRSLPLAGVPVVAGSPSLASGSRCQAAGWWLSFPPLAPPISGQWRSPVRASERARSHCSRRLRIYPSVGLHVRTLGRRARSGPAHEWGDSAILSSHGHLGGAQYWTGARQ